VRRVTAAGVSAIIATVVAAGPIFAVFIGGLSVPMVYQMKFNSPVSPMRQGDTWIQTFYFPDRPIDSLALRPGTYGRRTEGTVTVWIGAAYIPRSSNKKAFGREFSIDLGKLSDSCLQTFDFPAIQLESGTRGVIRFSGTDIRNESFTLWKNKNNAYPDGTFTINGQVQKGDLVFKIFSRVHGLDALRMIKSRWQNDLPGVWANLLWPIAASLMIFGCLFVWLMMLCCGNRRRPS
jgi:hypothetical protein